MFVNLNTVNGRIDLLWSRAKATRVVMLITIATLLDGCGRWSSKPVPKITFTNVPAVYDGGLDVLTKVSGTVTGAEPGQHVVLYARSEGRWWMQPPASTERKDGFTTEWQGQTHPGMEYAALLVDAGTSPPLSTERLPPVSPQVAAVSITLGSGSRPASAAPKVLHFSGYDWTVRTEPSHRGGSRNVFDPKNAWVDSEGALHLKISRQGDHWTCSEVKLTHGLGYGTYLWVVRDTSHLDLSAVLTLDTWDGGGPEENRHEVSYEISHWGSPQDKTNTTMLIQPYYIATNGVRFQSPAGPVTESYRWGPSEVVFSSYSGIHAGGVGGHLLRRQVFSSGIPAAGGDTARMNLYVFGKGQIPIQHENEIIIDKFEYLP